MNLDIKSATIILFAVFVGVFFGSFWRATGNQFHHTNMHAYEAETGDREMLIGMKDHMIGEMMADGDYKCCLEKPCTYCIEKTPGHGEGATCTCLEDIMNGTHPCGECMGEILEGHGNRFIAKYFATAIAEELGEEHLGSIKQVERVTAFIA